MKPIHLALGLLVVVALGCEKEKDLDPFKDKKYDGVTLDIKGRLVNQDSLPLENESIKFQTISQFNFFPAFCPYNRYIKDFPTDTLIKTFTNSNGEFNFKVQLGYNRCTEYDIYVGNSNTSFYHLEHHKFDSYSFVRDLGTITLP